MHRKLLVTAVAALLVPLGAQEGPARDRRARPFTLVYHSDTRGYYRPCG